MVVVISRRIAVELYRALVALRPAWHGEDDEHGTLKVVVTGAAMDPLDWQPHIRNKPRIAGFQSSNQPTRELAISRNIRLQSAG